MKKTKDETLFKILPINQAGVKGVPDALPFIKQINEFALEELSVDDVYVRKMRLAHDQVDRTGERFSEEILKGFASSAPGRSLLIGHNRGDAPSGKFFRGEVVDDGKAKWLETYFYTVKTPANEHLRRQIAGGVYSDVSIGFWAEKLVCDICGQDMYSTACPHMPLKEYDGVVATGTWTGGAEMREGSIVYMGAQQGAQFIKALEKHDPEEDEEADKTEDTISGENDSDADVEPSDEDKTKDILGPIRRPAAAPIATETATGQDLTFLRVPYSVSVAGHFFALVVEMNDNYEGRTIAYYLGTLDNPIKPQEIGETAAGYSIYNEEHALSVLASILLTATVDLQQKMIKDFPSEEILKLFAGIRDKLWEDKENVIMYRVKDPSLFQEGSFRSKDWPGVKGLRMIIAKYTEEHNPEGHDINSTVIQSLRFAKPTWDMPKAKKWVSSHSDTLKKDLDNEEDTTELSEEELEDVFVDKAVSGSGSLPLAPDGKIWQRNAADANAILGASDGEMEDLNWSRFANAHFWRDPHKKGKREGYKLNFAKMFDGELKAVWHGVAVAHIAVRGGRGGVDIPASDRPEVLAAIKHYYTRFDKPWPETKDNQEITDETKFQDITWKAQEKEIYEDIEVSLQCCSLESILAHWSKEDRDPSEPCGVSLKALLEKLTEVVQKLNARDQSSEVETPVGFSVAPLLRILNS